MHVRAGKLSPPTLARYETSVARLTLAFCGEPDELGDTAPTPVSLVTEKTLVDFVEARHEEERSPSTIRNDITACSQVLAYAVGKGWICFNPARILDRRFWIGSADAEMERIDPPNDKQVAALIAEVSAWRPDMAMLITWLRETRMRLKEALLIEAEDIHPDGRTATLTRGVKRGKARTIMLGRAAALLDGLPKRGRLFAGLHTDSAVVSTRYGQWRRQRQAREDAAAAVAGRAAEALEKFRLHDERHAYAIASLIDDPNCIYRLKEQLGHSSDKTTESYVRFLSGKGAQRRHARHRDMFGSLPLAEALSRAA